jgi:hypothetical protein
MAKTITLEELKTGDIVLYSPPPGKEGRESRIICFFTKSPVSHTGMIAPNHGYSIQEIPDGASCITLPEPGIRKLYIRRLEGEPDTSVVDTIAMKYVEEKLPYPMSNLAFLGLYMLASDFIPDSLGGSIFKNALKVASYELMKLINKHTHPGTDEPPMVCSQFAATCYDEAALTYGPQYKIHYNEDVSTFANLLRKIIDQLTEEEEGKTYSVALEENHPLLGGELEEDEADMHLQNLADHLDQKQIEAQQNEGQDKVLLAAKPEKVSEELIASFYQYGKGILKLFGNKTEYPDKKEATPEEIKSVLEELLRIQETFVTPGDLLSKTTNLMDMGQLVYTASEIAPYWNKNEEA